MNRDDDIGRALRHLASGVESNVRRPPARDILRRAGRHPAGRLSDEPKPFPWAGIAAVAAVPFVAIGAVLVGPAGAGIIGGDDQPGPQALPTADASASAEPSVPVETSAAPSPSSPAAPPAEPTGEQAMAPLTPVTVVFTDEQVAGEQCRRLTAADRFVEGGDGVEDVITATVDLLLEGPRPDESAVGLSSPVTPGAATVALDPEAMVVTVDVTDGAAWRDDCSRDEFQWALARTVGQFPGWSWTVTEAGVPLTPPADLLSEFEGVPDGPASPTTTS